MIHHFESHKSQHILSEHLLFWCFVLRETLVLAPREVERREGGRKVKKLNSEYHGGNLSSLWLIEQKEECGTLPGGDSS